MSDDSKNLSRVEDLLNNDPYLPKTPMSRVEKLLEDGILPKVTPADNGKILKVKDGEWETGEDISGDKLPPVSSADNGKVLKVVDAEWNIGEDEGDRLPFVTGADEGKVLKVNDQGHWEAEEEDPELPTTTSADAGKILKVDSNGDWSKGDETVELPSVSSSDNGKILKVNNGAWSTGDETKELPSATSSDKDKVLKVGSNGNWEKATDTAADTVSQMNTAQDKNLPILFSYTQEVATKTEEAAINKDLKYNPSRRALTLGDRANGSTIGTDSVSLGTANTASMDHSYAEGYQVTARGSKSHAEGAGSTASGDVSHAEGSSTTASGGASHAEGNNTTASGDNSHAEGKGTIANHRSQHTFGEYNALDSSQAAATARGRYAEIVGNGINDNDRSNARTLDWSGNEVLAGKLTVGAGPTNDMDAATKQYVDAHSGLPEVSSSDNGKILKVTEGNWAKGDAPSGLPATTSSDAGKILKVDSNGDWGKGDDLIPLTQAQYDALPSSKNSDGLLYFITDGEIEGLIPTVLTEVQYEALTTQQKNDPTKLYFVGGKYICYKGVTYYEQPYIALTQAQYDALPSSKLTDGKMYYITDQDGNELPAVTASDNGKVLKVVDGAWAKGDDIDTNGIVIVKSTDSQLYDNTAVSFETDIASKMTEAVIAGKTIYLQVGWHKLYYPISMMVNSSTHEVRAITWQRVEFEEPYGEVSFTNIYYDLLRSANMGKWVTINYTLDDMDDMVVGRDSWRNDIIQRVITIDTTDYPNGITSNDGEFLLFTVNTSSNAEVLNCEIVRAVGLQTVIDNVWTISDPSKDPRVGLVVVARRVSSGVLGFYAIVTQPNVTVHPSLPHDIDPNIQVGAIIVQYSLRPTS